MLTILGDGNSLPPFIVFRGTPKGIKEKKLKLHPKVITGDIYICCQANSWVDGRVLVDTWNGDRNSCDVGLYDVNFNGLVKLSFGELQAI